MMHTKFQKALHIALSAILSTTLAACIGGSSSTSETPPSSTQTPEPTQEPARYQQEWLGEPQPVPTEEPLARYPVRVFVDVSQSARGSDAMIRALIPGIHTISGSEPEWLMLRGSAPNYYLEEKEYQRVMANIEQSGSYLDSMKYETDENPIILSHMSEDAVHVFITDLETNNDISLFAKILKKSGCTGYTFHIVKAPYKGDIEYWKYDRIEGEEKKHAVVFEDTALERYCLVIVCGKEENVLDYDAKFLAKLSQMKQADTISSYDNYHVFYGQEDKEYQLSLKATESPATITGLKETKNSYTLGVENYSDTSVSFKNPNTFLFKKKKDNNIAENALQVVLYGIEDSAYPSLDPVIQNQKVYVLQDGKYVATKEIVFPATIAVSDGLRRIENEKMNTDNGGNYVSEDIKTLVLKIEKQDVPQKTYEISYTIGFPAPLAYESHGNKEITDWASNYSVDFLELDAILLKRDAQPIEGSSLDEPHYLITDLDANEQKTLSKMVFFSTFAKQFEDAHCQHQTIMTVNVHVSYE